MKLELEFESNNDYNVLKNKMNDYLKDWKNNFENNFFNFDYVVLDKDENVIKLNNNSLGELIKLKNINNLEDKYFFCIVIKFDENGKFNIENLYDGEVFLIGDKLVLRLLVYIDNYDIVNLIKNMIFIYGINKYLKYIDKILMVINRDNYRYEIIIYFYIIIFLVIIIILGLFILFKLENEISLYKKFYKLFFEIIFVLMSIFIIRIVLWVFDLICNIIDGSFVNLFLNEIFKIEFVIGNLVVYLFNVFYWLVYIILVFIIVIIIKNIFSVGLIKYFKEKIFIYIIIRFVKRIV